VLAKEPNKSAYLVDRAPLNAQVEIHIGPDFGIYTLGIMDFRCAISDASAEFAAFGAAAPAQLSGDLADGLFGIQEAVNLVSLLSAQLLVHQAT
jgi:hypothetical protein